MYSACEHHTQVYQTDSKIPWQPPADQKDSGTKRFLLSVKNRSGAAVPSSPSWHTIGKKQLTGSTLPALLPLIEGMKLKAQHPAFKEQVKDPSCLLETEPLLVVATSPSVSCVCRVKLAAWSGLR